MVRLRQCSGCSTRHPVDSFVCLEQQATGRVVCSWSFLVRAHQSSNEDITASFFDGWARSAFRLGRRSDREPSRFWSRMTGLESPVKCIVCWQSSTRVFPSVIIFVIGSKPYLCNSTVQLYRGRTGPQRNMFDAFCQSRRTTSMRESLKLATSRSFLLETTVENNKRWSGYYY